MSNPEPSAEEIKIAKDIIQQQMDAMMAAMKQIEAAVNTNIEKLDERLATLSNHVEQLKKEHEKKET